MIQILLPGGLSRIQVPCPYAGCSYRATAVSVPPRLKVEHARHPGEDRCAEALADHVRLCHRGVQ